MQNNEIQELSVDEIQLLAVDSLDISESNQDTLKIESPPGQCINNTDENIAVYGPKSSRDTSRYENSLYILPPNSKTPSGWDCDGFYIPNDRVANQALSRAKGPLAIKYAGGITFTITKSGNEYNCPLNQGAFLPSEVCCPSNYPRCVCWNIPDISQNQVTSFPPI
jgi:hypothetical protein